MSCLRMCSDGHGFGGKIVSSWTGLEKVKGYSLTTSNKRPRTVGLRPHCAGVWVLLPVRRARQDTYKSGIQTVPLLKITQQSRIGIKPPNRDTRVVVSVETFFVMSCKCFDGATPKWVSSRLGLDLDSFIGYAIR